MSAKWIFTFSISFIFTLQVCFISPIFEWRNWSSEKLSPSPRVIGPGSRRIRPSPPPSWWMDRSGRTGHSCWASWKLWFLNTHQAWQDEDLSLDQGHLSRNAVSSLTPKYAGPAWSECGVSANAQKCEKRASLPSDGEILEIPLVKLIAFSGKVSVPVSIWHLGTLWDIKFKLFFSSLAFNKHFLSFCRVCSAPSPEELRKGRALVHLRCSRLLDTDVQTTTPAAASERWRRGAANTLPTESRDWGAAQPESLGCMGALVKGKLALGSCFRFLADGLMKCNRRQATNVSQGHTSLRVIRNKTTGSPSTVLTQCGDSCTEQRWLFYMFSHWKALLL